MKTFLSLREDREEMTEQCVERLRQATGESRDEAARHTVSVRCLVEGLADSLNTMSPQGFIGSMDACRGAHATVAGPIPFSFSDIISVMEETVMDRELDAEQTRFLWRLFRRARQQIAPAAASNVSRDTRESGEAALEGPEGETTEGRRADRELRERERRFRNLAESIPQVIFEMDENRTITFANRQAFEIFGYDEEDLSRGIDAFSLFVPEDFPAMSTNLGKIAQGEASPGNEYTAVRKDGTSFPVIIHVARTMDEGRLIGFRGIIVDITERKKAEEELRESRQFFQDIADRIPGVIYQFYAKPSGEMGLSYISRTSKEFLGIDAGTFHPFERFVEGLTPDCRDRFLDSIEEAIAREQDWQFEGDFMKPTGEIMSFAGMSRPSRVGDTLRFNGVLLDITSRKRAEERLKESERKFRDIAELMPQVIFEIDTKGSVVFVNKQAFEFFGYKEGDLPGGFNCFEHIAPEDRPRALANLQKVAEGGPAVGNQYTAVRKDGQRFPIIIYVTRIMKNDRLAGYRGIIIDISERIRAEEALKQGEKRLRQIIDLVPHFIFAKDIDGRFILANKAVADTYGTTVEDLIGKVDARFSPSDEEVRHFREDDLDVMVRGRRKYIPDESITDAQGNVRYLQTVKIPFTFSGTETPAVLGVSVDITEHKRTEEQLRLDESRTETLLKLNQMGNRPLEEITAFTLEESIRFTKSTLGYIAFLNDDESILTMHSWSRRTMEECRIQDKPISYPLKTTGIWGNPVRERRPIITNDYTSPGVARKGYPEGHVEVRRHLGVPIFDGERIVAVIGVGNKEEEYGETDINQLQLMAQGMIRLLKEKAAREALSVSESRLRAVIDSAKDAIFIKDRDRRYIVANRAMSEIFGIPIEKILGASDRDLFPDEAADHIENVDHRVLNGETIEEEITRTVTAAAHVLHTIKVPLRNDRGETTGLCGIARDVTERKHLESQLLQSQKMEAVGTLAGGVAHDFNNLLSAIMGYASLLQMKMDKDNPLYSYASQILVSSEKAANLTQSLLAFSRKQVINLKPVAINDAVDKLHRLLERLIPEDVEFRIRKASERLVVMADPGQLDQVVMNLVTNARDAMPRGGKLTITVDRATVGNEFIATHGYGKAGEYALVAISDTGIGMDGRVMEKIFEPFFTTKGIGRGTGLGLAIVYGIIKQHNGYIDVTSRPGQGSVFCVYLPLVWLEPADEEESAPITGGTETILIAEDNADLCELSVRVLEDHGYTVLAAKDGAMAVETFRRHRDTISLVILDVVMPRMNGKEACEAIRHIDPSMKVIFTSGYTDDIIQEKGMLHEEYDFLGKPITPATLLSKIREVLERR